VTATVLKLSLADLPTEETLYSSVAPSAVVSPAPTDDTSSSSSPAFATPPQQTFSELLNDNMTSAAASTGTLATLLPSWECDSVSKYSPIKVEPIEDIVLAELKPPVYGYETTTSLTGLDSMLTTAVTTATNNNNNKGVTDLNLSSPVSVGGPASNGTSSSSSSSSSSSLSGQSLAHTHPALNGSSGQSDVTSSGSTPPPPPITKWETIDFSKDAFDDLGSIVEMSMSADSTVPNIEDALDWIDIKPLTLNNDLNLANLELGGLNAASGGTSTTTTTTMLHPVTVVTGPGGTTATFLTNHHSGNLLTTTGGSLSCHRINSLGNPVINATQPYLQMNNGQHTTSISVTNTSTLQSLLQGNLHPTPASALAGKVTQLQQREGPLTTLQPPPPPYSILQNRLTHGPPTTLVAAQPPLPNSHVIKVDSTYDMMKTVSPSGSNAASPTGTPSSYLTSNYADSTQSPLNHVTTSDQSSDLQQRLSELGGLKIKTAKKVRKGSLASNGGGSSVAASAVNAAAAAVAAAAAASNGSSAALAAGLNDKKMMHHCQICHRGFLNKSNIKVHLRTHTGEKPFQCEHCSKAFRQKAHLLKHMSIHKRISRD